MQIKYYQEDGSEQIVNVEERPDGVIVLPKDLVIPCGCSHDPVAVKGTMWPAALVFLAGILCITAIAWKLLDAVSA